MERVHRRVHGGNGLAARRPDTSTRPVDRPLFIQPKLAVGAVNDPDEREADRVAEQIVAVLRRQSSGSAPALPTAASGNGRVRRSSVAGGIRRRVAGDSGASSTSGVGRIRRASTVVGAEGGVVGGEIESRIRRAGEGRALDAGVKSQMEGAFGTDFSNVRLHTDSDIAPMIGAHAFTHGSDVHIARGNYQPDSVAGQRLLAHELTHVVQQDGGASRASRVSRLVAPADPKKAQKKFSTARAEQTKARTKLAQMVQEGMAQVADQRLKNACEWVNSGRAKLYAVTRTGDSKERVTEAGDDPKDTSAWFPAGTDVTQPGHLLVPQWNYDWYDLENNANIEFDDNTTGGWNLPGIVAIVDPHKKSKKEIWETIKHEVQHDSDRNIDEKNEVRTAAMAGGLTKDQAEESPAYKLVRYKTEYRAYNYEGGAYDKYSPTKIVTKAGCQWTERQFAIFNHIYGAYSHTETGWDDDLSVGGGITFRQAVLAYRDPDSQGFNKWDSIRIDEVYNEIFALADNTSDYIDMAIVHSIPQKVRALTPAEARYVVQESPDWDKLIQKKLSDIAYSMVMDRFATRPASRGVDDRMTRLPVPAPELSADGRRIAVQLGTQLVVADTTSGEIDRLASDDGVDRLAWSPDGAYLAVLGAGRLAVFSVASDGIEQHSVVDASPAATDLSVDRGGRAVTDAPTDVPNVDRTLPVADGHLVSPDGSHVAWWSVDGLGRNRVMTIGLGSSTDDGGDVVRDGLPVDGEHVTVGVDDEGTVRAAWGTTSGTVEVLELRDDGLEQTLTLSTSD